MDQPKVSSSRREFLALGLAASAATSSAQSSASTPPAPPDYRKLISRADLYLDAPVSRSEGGVPIGNGRTGTLVWTSPSTLRLQINRVDVYANDSYTTSFYERNTDYCGGCAYADLDFGAFGADVFPNSGFRQHLSVYDGLLNIDANGVRIRALACHDRDVIAIHIEDQRPASDPVRARLRMLRYLAQNFGRQTDALTKGHTVIIQTREHRATSQLSVHDDRIVLTQDFREGDYINRSAVALAIAGRKAKARIQTEDAVQIAAEPGPGTYTILIASAAPVNATDDIVASALAQLDAAASAGFDRLAQSNQNWWRDFWSRGFIQVNSADANAALIERNYHYFLYLMASSSRGKYPPKFNGMIWSTGGDLRSWGAQHWFANLSCYYEAIPACNRMELLDPVYSMYSGMYEASTVAARQQWGSQGIFIPETTWHNGLAKLPDDIALEMRELYLLQKPWDQRSPRFREFSLVRHPHSSRWNWWASGSWVEGKWVPIERGSGPYGPVTHNFGTTAKVAYLYWRKYEYTLDRQWLSERAYPMLKGAAELYRNFPNVKKGPDGRYHIHHMNSNESVWGARDSDEDISAMRAIFPAVIRASEILDRDGDLRAQWREFLDHLPGLPASDDPLALKPEGYSGPRIFVRGSKPVVKAAEFPGLDGNSLPQWFFDHCNLESTDASRLQTANNTLSNGLRRGPDTPVGLLSKVPMAAASLGRADGVRYLIANQIRGRGANLENWMSLREGPGALDAEALGRAAEATQLALLQSNPPAPAADPVIRVFPAWPKDWDATFTLAARGAFTVTSSIQNGTVTFVELHSKAGAPCKLRNPWGDRAVTLERNGKKAETLKGSLLAFATHPAETIVLR